MNLITISVYEEKGDIQQLIAEMNFIRKSDYKETETLLVKAQPTNSLRRERYECCHIIVREAGKAKYEYYGDAVTDRIRQICEKYTESYRLAHQIAQARCWKYAWAIASEQWRYKAVLRNIKRAQKLLRNSSIGTNNALPV